jgi:hypothetical protein
LNTGVTCDAIGCIGKLADGRLASMVLDVEAFAEDCGTQLWSSAHGRRRCWFARPP